MTNIGETDMRTAIVLSTHAARFDAVAFKGDFEANVAKIADWGYNGVELAIRDPRLVDADALLSVVNRHELEVPAIGTGQAWGEEGLSFTDPSPDVRAAASTNLGSRMANSTPLYPQAAILATLASKLPLKATALNRAAWVERTIAVFMSVTPNAESQMSSFCTRVQIIPHSP